MILLLGAKYTGYMTRANSVLIAKWSGEQEFLRIYNRYFIQNKFFSIALSVFFYKNAYARTSHCNGLEYRRLNMD